MSGEAVWQLLRGDWFDAAQIYRQWAMQHAKWWPALGPDGRADTPLWMRELPAWALASGSPESVVPQMKRFAEALGVPVGVHWYNWHQIPFDNDYPHYFPTLDGFEEGVAELQRGQVYVMPYINGRLWDTRDRGQEDFEFTKVARPAATKDEKGEPYVESYGSKETDGSPVRLAAMCPTTEIWRNKRARDRRPADERVRRQGGLHRPGCGGVTPAVLRPLARPSDRAAATGGRPAIGSC